MGVEMVCIPLRRAKDSALDYISIRKFHKLKGNTPAATIVSMMAEVALKERRVDKISLMIC
jgi:hypothetical protein